MGRLKREIAGLLRDNKEEKARIKAEQFIQEQKMECAYDIIETQCELIATRLKFIESQKDCPADLKPTLHSILYSESRAGIDELAEVRKQLQNKFGKEFVERAQTNADEVVHQKLIFLLSVAPPAEYEVVRVLRDVAQEFGVSWVAPPQVDLTSGIPFDDFGNDSNTGGGGGGSFVPQQGTADAVFIPTPSQGGSSAQGVPPFAPQPGYVPQQQQHAFPSVHPMQPPPTSSAHDPPLSDIVKPASAPPTADGTSGQAPPPFAAASAGAQAPPPFGPSGGADPQKPSPSGNGNGSGGFVLPPSPPPGPPSAEDKPGDGVGQDDLLERLQRLKG